MGAVIGLQDGLYRITHKTTGETQFVEVRYSLGWGFKWVHNPGSYAILPLNHERWTYCKWERMGDL